MALFPPGKLAPVIVDKRTELGLQKRPCPKPNDDAAFSGGTFHHQISMLTPVGSPFSLVTFMSASVGLEAWRVLRTHVKRGRGLVKI